MAWRVASDHGANRRSISMVFTSITMVTPITPLTSYGTNKDNCECLAVKQKQRLFYLTRGAERSAVNSRFVSPYLLFITCPCVLYCSKCGPRTCSMGSTGELWETQNPWSHLRLIKPTLWQHCQVICMYIKVWGILPSCVCVCVCAPTTSYKMILSS